MYSSQWGRPRYVILFAKTQYSDFDLYLGINWALIKNLKVHESFSQLIQKKLHREEKKLHRHRMWRP